MVYKARTQQGVHVFFAVMAAYLLVTGWDSVYLRTFTFMAMGLNLLALFVKFEFVIGADDVTLRTHLFQLKCYEKRVDKDSIKQVVFKRAGWKTKSATIKLNQGFPIRLHSFSPDTLFEELQAFCETHDIPYTKTHDFLLLEKLS